MNLPSGRSPPVVCNKLETGDGEDGNDFVVHSCPADDSGSCPANCDACKEDYVKHFEVNVCKDGWLLVAGAAPEDCDSGHLECNSKNQVDIGLARWCEKW